MPLVPYSALVVSYDSDGPAPGEYVSPAKRIVWTAIDPDFPSIFVQGIARFTQSGGTNPTLAGFVQVSNDGTNWYTIDAEVEMDDTETEYIGGGPELQGWNYVRLKLVMTGGANVAGFITMFSSSPFRLDPVS